MAEGASTEDGGKTWRIKLRPDLAFHDGAKVLARDCAASIRRWGARDGFGQALLAATDEISAPDDTTILIRLKAPFPLLPDALGKTPPSICPIMPERLATTDPYKQITEMVGSGPYKYIATERVPGSLVVYERNTKYVPRPNGTPSGTAGPKIAHIDRIEWHIIPDPSTVAGALQTGEIDWWLTPQADQLPLLKKQRNLKVENIVPTGFVATLRFNQLTPPFDNHVPCGIFTPNTPLATNAGMNVLTSKRDPAKVKRDLEAAGYKGEKVVVLTPTDIASAKALADITADMLHRLGMNVDAQAMDWATLVQRRAKMDPADKGGWSIFHTSWSGLDQINPAGHIFLRANGKAASPGWPTSAKLEELRDAWFKAPDLAAQQSLAKQIQLEAFQDVPYIPLGQYFQPTAYQANLTGMLTGNPMFWNIKRG
jgi:peptide/nickel transport system substrate-binding protein